MNEKLKISIETQEIALRNALILFIENAKSEDLKDIAQRIGVVF